MNLLFFPFHRPSPSWNLSISLRFLPRAPMVDAMADHELFQNNLLQTRLAMPRLA
jgi:hypothetical protein